MPTDLRKMVVACLDQLDGPDAENAFHTLIETLDEARP